MADNFLAAIQTGIQMGHAIDSAKMQRAQMERMALEMQRAEQDQLMQMAAFNEARQEKATRKALYAPETTKPGGDEYTGPMDEIVPGGPGREALRGQYGDMGDLAANLIYGGMNPTEAKAFLPKEAKPQSGFNLSPGQTRYEMGADGKPVATVTSPAADREVNIANDVDTVLGMKFGKGYYQDKKVRSEALDWMKTPEGNKYVKDSIREMKALSPVNFQVIQTDKGLTAINPRNPTAPSVDIGGKPTPAGEIKTGTYIGVIMDAIGRIKQNYNPEYVGPVAGRFGSLKGTVVDLPEEQTTFYADVNDVKDQLLRARSGAQINEQEYARLVKFLPDANNPSGNFVAKLNRFETEMNNMIQRRANELREGGYKRSGESIAPSGPRIGEVLDGFRFMGGNPANQKSWKKVGK